MLAMLLRSLTSNPFGGLNLEPVNITTTDGTVYVGLVAGLDRAAGVVTIANPYFVHEVTLADVAGFGRYTFTEYGSVVASFFD